MTREKLVRPIVESAGYHSTGSWHPMPEQWRTNVQYLLMIYADQAAFATMTPEQGKAMTESYAQFTQDIVKSGHLKGGDRLKPANTATTIRLKDGKPMMTDGPFAETREQLAGYYLIEAKDLDEATMIASRIPMGTGAIEVRPVDVMARQY
jgi:hypothetical protein